MGVWDMGQYYRGEHTWKLQLTKNVQAWKSHSGNTKLFWLRLHKLYPDRGECKKNPKCYLSNTSEKERKFREISDQIMSSSIIPIDTLNITSTPQAAIDGNDGVHFGKKTTRLEAEITTNILRKFKCFS